MPGGFDIIQQQVTETLIEKNSVEIPDAFKELEKHRFYQIEDHINKKSTPSIDAKSTTTTSFKPLSPLTLEFDLSGKLVHAPPDPPPTLIRWKTKYHLYKIQLVKTKYCIPPIFYDKFTYLDILVYTTFSMIFWFHYRIKMESLNTDWGNTGDVFIDTSYISSNAQNRVWLLALNCLLCWLRILKLFQITSTFATMVLIIFGKISIQQNAIGLFYLKK